MKIVITARDFTSYNTTAYDRLMEAGHEVIDYSSKNFGSGTNEIEVAEALQDAQIAIAGLEPFTETVIRSCPKLQMISRRGIGYDSVNLSVCKERGITLARTVGAVEGSVAEQVIAYILYFARRIDLQNADMQKNIWQRRMTPGAKGRTLGLIGFGGIGKEIAKRAIALGMKVVYYCRNPKSEWDSKYGVTYVSQETLLQVSDYVSVNVPLTEETKLMCNYSMFEQMKQGSIFINISRGGIMESNELRLMLEQGHLAGAAIDVFDHEPCTDSPLVGCVNAILTPHTAPYTVENFIGMNEMAAENVLDFIHGKLSYRNRVL